MPDPYRVLVVSSQPVHMEECSLSRIHHALDFDVTVAYCSMPDHDMWRGPEYLTKSAFAVDMPTGYRWIHLPNRARRPRLDRFWGVVNPGVTRLIRDGDYDCCIIYGYGYATYWMALFAAKSISLPVLLTTDATTFNSASGARWRGALKRLVLPWIFRLADHVLAPSTATMQFLAVLGVEETRRSLTPYVIDNAAFSARAADASRHAIRASWGIPLNAVIALFCGKLIDRKRPIDAIRAFVAADVPGSYLVIIGDGPLRWACESVVAELGATEAIRFRGIVSYADLPAAYAGADLLIHPAAHEPWGLPVNEAMVCGLPAIVSDQVGAGYDLVTAGKTGEVFRVGDVTGLSMHLRNLLADPERLRVMGLAAQLRMQSWSPSDNATNVMAAVRVVLDQRARRRELCAS